MFNRCNNEQYIEVYKLWKDIFKEEDVNDIDIAFKYMFNKDYIYIKLVDNIIVSSLVCVPYTLVLNNKEYKVGFISGVLTKEEYRNKGYMKELMIDCITYFKKEYDALIIQSNKEDAYVPFGFKQLIYSSTTKYENVSLKDMNIINDPEILLDIYNTNISNGIRRDITYYNNYIKLYNAMGYEILGIENKGYIVVKDNYIEEYIGDILEFNKGKDTYEVKVYNKDNKINKEYYIYNIFNIDLDNVYINQFY